MKGNAPGDDHLVGRLGAIIATERASRGFSIEELAGRAGISNGLLSQLERGIGNPSIDTLSNIARALGLSIGSFFLGTNDDDADGVVHPHTRARLVLADQNLTYQLLVPDLQGALSMLYIEVPAHFSNEHAPFSHSGEEVVFILQGRMEVHVGNLVRVLEQGDSMRFASVTKHWYRTFDEDVVSITAMTPPSF
ncbi:helix-turn-helix domain-containing protein [Sinosporangium siamense]|uniref:Transcriptional regulator n=1 Tax=Sinosporangium siamense TaxID=1367973 RepID=A0A919RF05_9ACTN|nr:XRE family transcriptional regulator [Sinosporangium siamense]GII91595.1 transcriptional regulator [Sinosporangium siamense]